MDKQPIVDPKKIYVIRMTDEKEPVSIAMNVDLAFRDFKGICYLTPPDRPHMIKGKMGKKTENGFTFISEGFEPGEWEFTELTYDVLKAGFYKHIYGGKQLLEQVHSTQELQDYYHSNLDKML